LVLFAVYNHRPLNLQRIFCAAKWIMLIVTLGSLIAIFVIPEFVLNRPVPSWIPGVNWRLFGLTTHANTLGPVALLALVVELQHPFKSLLLRALNLISAVSVLLLAQSKTAWIAALVILALVWAPISLRQAFADATPLRRFNQFVWTSWAAIAVLLVIGGFLIAFDVVGRLLSRSDLLTLTGRTEIWDITLRAWKENLLFGFGPQVWGPERQLRFQMFHVGHAHNQLIQSLGEAGIVGLLLLLAYVGVLLYAAVRCFVQSRGMVLALLLLLLVRCVTEVPLSRSSLLSWDVFLHILLFLTACHYLRVSNLSSGCGASEPALRVKTNVLFKIKTRPFNNLRISLLSVGA
jgi:exopolysaccharide production protein ExoQ